MKISKSKQELARIISENGGWCDGAQFSAQDKDGEVFHYATKPSIDKGSDVWGHKWCIGYGEFEAQTLPNWHQTILSRAEYFHLYPAQDADGWIEWAGGECPVNMGTLIDVKYRDGHLQLGCRAKSICDTELYATTHCGNSGGGADIIAYRLHKPEQAKPEFCESVMRSIQEPEVKQTIEQLAADYRNAKDFAERKRQEADAAKEDADAKLKALELACEEIGFSIAPITAKEEPELVITDWRDLRAGDVVEAVVPNGGIVKAGELGVIILTSEDKMFADFQSQKGYVCYKCQFERGDVKLIRRT